jgi:UDP-N-acetylglucosamine diphosphorylase / glucose-1-phosphate thymidylyltransferase / UDP-N-acetylgalactosamine diphosphorylase / glucosamine-1-phosphate N-acetyltransferase / galactosamine-1-phosphate N-acetyltransferase
VKAIILAAGRGTRMGSLTADIPKPMLVAAGKPLLEHILDRMREAGVDHVLLVVGYRREVIQEHFAGYELDIEYAVQETLDGTGRAVALGRGFAGGDPFLVTFGDIVCESADYRGIIDDHVEAAGVLGAKWLDDPYQGAAIYEENGVVRSIIEKPPKGTSTTHWNSAGLYTFEPELFDYLDRLDTSPRGEYELTSAVAAMIADGRRMLLYAIQGSWRDVGRPEDLPIAQDLLD